MLNELLKVLFDNKIEYNVVYSQDYQVEDDEVELGGDYHIQVGEDYLILNRWDEEEQAMYHGKPSKNPHEVVQSYLLKELENKK